MGNMSMEKKVKDIDIDVREFIYPPHIQSVWSKKKQIQDNGFHLVAWGQISKSMQFTSASYSPNYTLISPNV
jgi:hypothetical protein